MDSMTYILDVIWLWRKRVDVEITARMGCCEVTRCLSQRWSGIDGSGVETLREVNFLSLGWMRVPPLKVWKLSILLFLQCQRLIKNSYTDPPGPDACDWLHICPTITPPSASPVTPFLDLATRSLSGKSTAKLPTQHSSLWLYPTFHCLTLHETMKSNPNPKWVARQLIMW